MSTAESARTAAVPTPAAEAPVVPAAPAVPTVPAAPAAAAPAKAAPAAAAPKAAAPKAATPKAAAPAAAAPAKAAPAVKAAAAQPAPRPSPAAAKATAIPNSGLRRIRLTVSRVDPWSAMKIAFLLSVALGIAMVVMTAVLWTILSGMGVFTKVNSMIGSVIQEGGRPFDIMDFVGFGRVISLSVVFAVLDVILMTALATLGAFLYNVSSSLVGGAQVTLTDE